MKDFTEPDPRPRKRLVRKRKESLQGSSIRLFITLVALFIVALFFVQQRIDYTRSEKTVRDLIIEKRKIIASILPLKLEERYLTRLSEIEKTARNQIYLRRPSREQIVVMETAVTADNP